MNHDKTRAAGFTLLEIMVALVILSSGLVLVARASHHILGALGHSRETLRAGMLLQERMEVIRGEILVDPESPPQSGSGRFAAPFDDYEWTLMVTERPAAETATKGRLSELTLQVRRIDGTTMRSGASFGFYPK